MAVVHLVLQSSCQPLDDKYSVSILKNTFGVIHYSIFDLEDCQIAIKRS